MNSKSYRWCSVPQCTNTSIKTPNKLFVFVPYKKTIRDMWLKLARRDLSGILPKTQLYFCEDHFYLPNDMENYMQYHIMGSVSQVRIKPGCIPSKFECQTDRRKRISDIKERYVQKKQRKQFIEEIINESSTSTNPLEVRETSSENAAVPDISSDLRVLPQNRTHGKTIPQLLNQLSKIEQDSEDECRGFKCKECLSEVSGFRYTCVQCSDWDLCAECDKRGVHAHHFVLRVPQRCSLVEAAKVKQAMFNSLIQLRNMTNMDILSTDVQDLVNQEEIVVKEELIDEQDHNNFYPDDQLSSCTNSFFVEDEIEVLYDKVENTENPLKIEPFREEEYISTEETQKERKVSQIIPRESLAKETTSSISPPNYKYLIPYKERKNKVRKLVFSKKPRILRVEYEAAPSTVVHSDNNLESYTSNTIATRDCNPASIYQSRNTRDQTPLVPRTRGIPQIKAEK